MFCQLNYGLSCYETKLVTLSNYFVPFQCFEHRKCWAASDSFWWPKDWKFVILIKNKEIEICCWIFLMPNRVVDQDRGGDDEHFALFCCTPIRYKCLLHVFIVVYDEMNLFCLKKLVRGGNIDKTMNKPLFRQDLQFSNCSLAHHWLRTRTII